MRDALRLAEINEQELDLKKQQEALDTELQAIERGATLEGKLAELDAARKEWLADKAYEIQIRLIREGQKRDAIKLLRERGIDHVTLNRLKSAGAKGMVKVYESVPLLPMNALNRKWPINKTITAESGWDRFANSMVKGWHYFTKWFCSEGWKLLLSIGVDILISCIPGVGPLLGMVARTGADVMLDVLDHAKSSAERAHLQRAIEEGKSRGLDEWDEMFLWRSTMIILMLCVAQREGWILQGQALRDVFRTREEFMQRIQDPEFLKALWSVEGMAAQEVFGIDPDNPDEAPFEKVPEDVSTARQLAYDLFNEMVQDGTMRGYSVRDMKKWLQ